MKNEKLLRFIAYVLVLVGAISWGLIGLMAIDIIGSVLGTFLSRLVYILIGVAGGYLIYLDYIKTDKPKA